MSWLITFLLKFLLANILILLPEPTINLACNNSKQESQNYFFSKKKMPQMPTIVEHFKHYSLKSCRISLNITAETQNQLSPWKVLFWLGFGFLLYNIWLCFTNHMLSVAILALESTHRHLNASINSKPPVSMQAQH